MAAYLSFYQITSVIWALVSDGRQAYAFKYRKNETVFKDKFFVVHNKIKAQAVPVQESPSTEKAKDANDPCGCFRKTRNEDTKNFIPAIAAKLEEAFDGNAFDYLVIVAPQCTMNALCTTLSDRILCRLLTTIPEGYVYDKGGAIFALRDVGADAFKPGEETLRQKPSYRIRNEQSYARAWTGRYSSAARLGSDLVKERRQSAQS